MNKLKKKSLGRFHLVKKATMDDFKYISEWLSDAYNNHKNVKGYALYHNLNWIREAFEEHAVFVVRYEGKAIAFLTFSPPYGDCIRIVFRMVCVKPDFLRMGLATYLHKSAIKHFQKQGCFIAELWNVCSESYKLGKSMGFVKKQENNNETSMVKKLIETRKQNCRANLRFVVWANYDGSTDTEPIYSWSLNFRRDKKPIIHALDFDWTVGIIKEKQVVYSGIAKCFLGIFPSGGDYIYIDEEKIRNILKLISI